MAPNVKTTYPDNPLPDFNAWIQYIYSLILKLKHENPD
jgi:hypothetical protein